LKGAISTGFPSIRPKPWKDAVALSVGGAPASPMSWVKYAGKMEDEIRYVPAGKYTTAGVVVVDICTYHEKCVLGGSCD
jgi:hypothetical protein